MKINYRRLGRRPLLSIGVTEFHATIFPFGSDNSKWRRPGLPVPKRRSWICGMVCASEILTSTTHFSRNRQSNLVL